LRQVDGGEKSILAICQEANISEVSFHRWKKQFGQMEVNEAKRMKELERENGELKKMLAEGLLKNRVLEAVWNTIEPIEKRKDARLAREFMLALPREISSEKQVELVRGWCEVEFISKGLVVDFAIHKSKFGFNPHAHVLCTTRPVEGEEFGKKPSTVGHFNKRGVVGLHGKSELNAWRDFWAFRSVSTLQ
jgi:ATP-dependent exoDNAse (exonuclease V) alpha subunit